MKSSNSLLILMILAFLGCKKQQPEEKIADVQNPIIVNFDNQLAFKQFSKLNLDDKCVNLLDPTNTAESERKSVISSWSNFHKKVIKFLKDEKFDWEVTDSTISIYSRIYFDKKGNINYYVFNINTPSVTEEKKAEFENVLLKFSENVQLDLQRDQAFAQCGKTEYINY